MAVSADGKGLRVAVSSLGGTQEPSLPAQHKSAIATCLSSAPPYTIPEDTLMLWAGKKMP